jgi:hypothetical protein
MAGGSDTTLPGAFLSLSPCGERVGVRGSRKRRSKVLPLTLTLSP